MELSERQKQVLRSIVFLYILNASPVGSRNLSKYLKDNLDLSPATIRNVMADLEEMEFVTHPHTSAGRVPTDKGYRFYVDTISNLEYMSKDEKDIIKNSIRQDRSDLLLRDASKLLGTISRYLAVVQIPHLLDLIVHKIELIPIDSHRLLVVVALDSNIVRTVTLEAEFDFSSQNLGEITSYINEKVAGRKLHFLRDNFEEVIKDFEMKDTPVVRLFLDSLDNIFEYQGARDRLLTAGTQNLLTYPEFGDLERIRGVIELVENEDIIIHLLESQAGTDENIKVLIGSEIGNEMMDDYSIVLTNYMRGSARGSIGLIGPKRMNYPKMMSILAYFSHLLSKEK